MERFRTSIEQGATRRGARLVQRYPMTGVGLAWEPLTPGFLRTRPKRVPVEVVDLSVSGALLLAPANPVVRRGTVVPVESARGTGTVEVRHLHDHRDGQRRYYGTLFLHLDEPMRAWVFERVARLRGDDGDLEGEWNHAS